MRGDITQSQFRFINSTSVQVNHIDQRSLQCTTSKHNGPLGFVYIQRQQLDKQLNSILKSQNKTSAPLN